MLNSRRWWIQFWGSGLRDLNVTVGTWLVGGRVESQNDPLGQERGVQM